MAEKPDNSSNQKNRVNMMKTLNVAIEFGFIIVLPLLGFGYLGKYLDHRYHHSFFTLFGILCALLVSGVWFYRSITELMKNLKD